MGEALIIDTCRTPRGIGKAGKGALSHLHPQHLGSTVLSALADRVQLVIVHHLANGSVALAAGQFRSKPIWLS